LAKQWHPTKNNELTPFDVSKGSDKKVWWKCEKGKDHEWKTASPIDQMEVDALVGQHKTLLII
jgi:hypothetical protein